MLGFLPWRLLRMPSTLTVFMLVLASVPANVIADGKTYDTNFVALLEKHESKAFAKLVKTEYYQRLFHFSPQDLVTIFVPNDEAFERYKGVWESLDEDQIEAILKYLIVKGNVTMSSIKRGVTISLKTTLNQAEFTNVTGGQQLLLTKQPDDEVVVTSGLAQRGTVIEEDVFFSHGHLQIIDTVVKVPVPLAKTGRDAYTDMISFIGALYETGIYNEFHDPSDITIFIPRYFAFQRLAGRLATLDKTELQRLLRYHLVPKNVIRSFELVNNATWTTANNGSNLTLTRNGNNLYINSAQILQTDMLIANGIVHIIDNILSPEHRDARPDLNNDVMTQLPVFTPTGSTSFGPKVATPFVDSLPCTADCPEPEPTEEQVYATTVRYHVPVTRTNNIAPPHFTAFNGAGLGLAALGALAVL